MMSESAAFQLVEQMYHGCTMLLSTWRESGFGPEAAFARQAVVKSAGLREEEGIVSFGTDAGLVHWRFPLALGPAFAAAQLAYDITLPLSEPDYEGLRWVGEG